MEYLLIGAVLVILAYLADRAFSPETQRRQAFKRERAESERKFGEFHKQQHRYVKYCKTCQKRVHTTTGKCPYCLREI